MRGLIWKDILAMKKILRSYVIFLACYFLLGVLGIFEMIFITSFSVVVLMVLPISCFSGDEQAGWEKFVRVLPLGPREVVGARYLFVLLLLLVVSAIGLSAAAIFSGLGQSPWLEGLASTLAALGSALVVLDIMLPINYKLGPERARPYLFVVVFLPIAGLFLLGKLGLLDLSFLDEIAPRTAAALFAAFPLAALAGLLPSYLCSCRVLARKEP